MPHEKRIVAPGPNTRSVRTEDGTILKVPADWSLLPPGDAGLTRRVKATGPSWTVKEKRGRRTFSQGVWAPGRQIAAARRYVQEQRSSESYARRRAADQARRGRKQDAYVDAFRQQILEFLDFAPAHAALAERLADAVTQHATPVGSGTVARTTRIPIRRRAESAVIAWLRHHTTTYDSMKIARKKGSRREVRQQLAVQSRRLLQQYRKDKPVPDCPLSQALSQ